MLFIVSDDIVTELVQKEIKHWVCKRLESFQTSLFASKWRIVLLLQELRTIWLESTSRFMAQSLKIWLHNAFRSMSSIWKELRKPLNNSFSSMTLKKRLKSMLETSWRKCLVLDSRAMLQEDHQESSSSVHLDQEETPNLLWSLNNLASFTFQPSKFWKVKSRRTQK